MSTMHNFCSVIVIKIEQIIDLQCRIFIPINLPEHILNIHFQDFVLFFVVKCKKRGLFVRNYYVRRDKPPDTML